MMQPNCILVWVTISEYGIFEHGISEQGIVALSGVLKRHINCHLRVKFLSHCYVKLAIVTSTTR